MERWFGVSCRLTIRVIRKNLLVLLNTAGAMALMFIISWLIIELQR